MEFRSPAQNSPVHFRAGTTGTGARIERSRMYMALVLWLIFGALAGWLATLVMGINGRVGMLGNLLLGIAGAAVGGYLASLLGFGTITVFSWWGLIVAVGGACLCIFLANLLRGRA